MGSPVRRTDYSLRVCFIIYPNRLKTPVSTRAFWPRFALNPPSIEQLSASDSIQNGSQKSLAIIPVFSTGLGINTSSLQEIFESGASQFENRNASIAGPTRVSEAQNWRSRRVPGFDPRSSRGRALGWFKNRRRMECLL